MSELLSHFEETTIAVSPSRLVAVILLDVDRICELRVGTTIEFADESALIGPTGCSENIASFDESANPSQPMVAVAPEKDVHSPVVKIDGSTLLAVRVVFLKFVL
jgi:hypothetical protein